jgi:multiple sugar transport system substrate-binding protein
MATSAFVGEISRRALFLSRIHQIFGSWVSLLLIIFFLSGCSQNVDGLTTVTLSGWQSNPTERHIIERVLKNFEEKHPHIKVKFEVITDQYIDVIKTRLVGDAAPDVFYLEAFDAPLLMSYGVLEPLDGYITADFALEDFESLLLNAFKYQNKLYGLPKDFSTLALFYNQQFFRQANLKTPPKTWQQLRKYSQQLTVDTNGDRRIDRYGLGIMPELARQYFFMRAFGVQLIDRKGYANFAINKSTKALRDLVEQYQKDRTAAQPSDVGASSDSEMFGQGKAAMVIDGNWAIPYLKETFPEFEFATSELPSINGKKNTMVYTAAYVMNKKSKHKDAAWEMIAYLAGKEGMKDWVKGGVVLPSRRSILSEMGYRENPLYVPFANGLTYATIWQAGVNLPTIRTHFNNQFLSAFLGEQSLKYALQRARKDANREIKAADY